ncbi:methionyl-tRNA formyltransferase, partial [bacterium]|nr:methionyl-tRNA formyltransferase [bacterium]
MRNLKTNPIKTIFLGSGWESVETLKALYHDERFNIVGVITTTDKPVGRKHILTPSDVKRFADENGIEIFHTEQQTEKYQEALDLFNPELVVCKAFGEIVPRFFLEGPKFKAINIHFSLLPKYRGAVPIQKAILDGEKKTGISIMLMSEGLDKGDILDMYEEDILPKDTNQTLRKRLVKRSAEILGDVLEKWIHGEITAEKQDDSKATYCWKRDISKESAHIDWTTMDPEYIERMVRAFLPWPVVWTIVNDKRVKLFDVDIFKYNAKKTPGTLFVEDRNLLFSTKDEEVCIKVNELQIEGKQKMSAREYINGLAKS